MGKKSKQSAAGPAPVCNCALLCKDFAQSVLTGKDILYGIIDGIRAKEFPAYLPSAVIYVRLTNVRKLAISDAVKVDIVHSGDEDCVVLSGVVENPPAPTPFKTYTLEVPVTDVTFPRAGVYHLRVLHNDVPLMHTPINVVEYNDEGE